MKTEVNEQMERSQADIQELKKNLETLRSDVSALLASLRETAKGQMMQAKDRFWMKTRDLEGDAQSRLENALEMMKARGELARAKTLETVEHRPFASLAGAFAVGFLLASMMHRD